MQPQIVHGTWQTGDVDGETFVGFSGDDIPDGAENVETIRAYGARLSAPGYMDCTDWTLCAGRAEAAQYLLDTYFDFLNSDDKDEANTISELEALAKT